MKFFSLSTWLPRARRLVPVAYGLLFGIPIAAYKLALSLSGSQLTSTIIMAAACVVCLVAFTRFYWFYWMARMSSPQMVLLRRQAFQLARKCQSHPSAGSTIPVGGRVISVCTIKLRHFVVVNCTHQLPGWAADYSRRLAIPSSTYFIWKDLAASCWHNVPISIDVVGGRVNPKPWAFDFAYFRPSARKGVGGSTRTLSLPQMKRLIVLLEEYLECAPQPRR